MPKVRAKVTKKANAKNTLSRGRTKHKGSSSHTTTSDTEEYNSEYPGATDVDSSMDSLFSRAPTSTENKAPSTTAETEVAPAREPWEDIPDLVTELKNSQPIQYVTNDLRHREFELNARKELLMMYEQLDLLKEAAASALKTVKNFCPETKDGKISDAIKFVKLPTTFKDLVSKLLAQPMPIGSAYSASIRPRIVVHEPLFEVSEEEEDEDDNFTKTRYKNMPTSFPSPAKMAKYATPKQQPGFFNFGTRTRGTGLSTNKAPRLAKPGEVVYSEGGSPILQRRVPEPAGPLKPHERFEVFNDDGSKIEVDLVYRDVPDAGKIRGFKEFAKDVRDIATRSTVKQNRIQQPRVGQKITPVSASASATKKKPGWR